MTVVSFGPWLRTPFVVAGSDCSAVIRGKADAVGDGTGAGDFAALNSINTSGAVNTRPIIGYGTFKPNAALSFGGNFINMKFQGSTIFVPDIAYPGTAIKFAGSRTNLGCVFDGTTLAQGLTVIPYTSITTLPAVGDKLGLVSADVTTGQPFGGSIAERPGENMSGEWLDVEAVDGVAKTITIRGGLREAYNTGAYTFKLFRYNLIRELVVEGLHLVGPGGTSIDGVAHATTTVSSDGTHRGMPLHVEYAMQPVMSKTHLDDLPNAREGLGVYECFNPIVESPWVKNVLDTSQSGAAYEGYGVRFMGCQDAIVTGLYGDRGVRHFVEANGGNNGYGLGSAAGAGLRPINRNLKIENSQGYMSYAAAFGDHPGCEATTYRNLEAHGCSGLIFSRGHLTAAYGRLAMYQGQHLTGPYASNQGNDHMIQFGEQLRDTGGSNRVDSHDGWCGTDIAVNAEVIHDMKGNGGVTASTSDTFRFNHPMVSCSVKAAGKMGPTGNVLTAIGQYNDNFTIRIEGPDGANAFSGATNGWGVYIAPAATTPTTTTGQTSTNYDITVTGMTKPRQGVVYIGGNAVNDTHLASGAIEAQSRTLGGSLTSTSPLVKFAGSPAGGTGYHGLVRLRNLDLPDVNRLTAIDTTSASAPSLTWQGISKFLDGCKTPTGIWLAAGYPRWPAGVATSATLDVTGARGIVYLYRVEGTGQTLTKAQVYCATVTGTPGANGLGYRVGAYADDGTGNNPALAAPLLDSGYINVTTTAANTATISFTEPIGWYWVATVQQYDNAPGTWPTMAQLTTPDLMSPAGGVIPSGTAVVQARMRKTSTAVATATTSALPTLATLADEGTARTVGFLVA